MSFPKLLYPPLNHHHHRHRHFLSLYHDFGRNCYRYVCKCRGKILVIIIDFEMECHFRGFSLIKDKSCEGCWIESENVLLSKFHQIAFACFRDKVFILRQIKTCTLAYLKSKKNISQNFAPFVNPIISICFPLILFSFFC